LGLLSPGIGVGGSWILELNDYQQFLANNVFKTLRKAGANVIYQL
jgi:hypothetical protein